MQVILLERVENLGQMGDVVKVKTGYARNFLLPQKKALRATKENLSYYEGQKVELEAQNLQKKGEAEDFAKRIDGKIYNVVRQAGGNEQLYGSVTARDIQVVLEENGVKLNRMQIRLHHPIKTIGMHAVRVVLHPEVDAHIHLSVAKSTEEADMQHVLAEEEKVEAPAAANEDQPAEEQSAEETVEATAIEEASEEDKA